MKDVGLESFCNKKQINMIKTVRLFTKETGFQVSGNFGRFATFVDKKIKSGELKGDDTPINKHLWEESKREQADWNAEMKCFNSEQKRFYRKSKEVKLDRFFAKKGIQKPKQTESKTKIGRMIPIFDRLVELGLLEEFLNSKEEKI